jgi:hypothetical protein
VRNRRLIRYEDKLQFAFIVEEMEGELEFIPILGEYRFLADNFFRRRSFFEAIQA